MERTETYVERGSASSFRSPITGFRQCYGGLPLVVSSLGLLFARDLFTSHSRASLECILVVALAGSFSPSQFYFVGKCRRRRIPAKVDPARRRAPPATDVSSYRLVVEDLQNKEKGRGEKRTGVRGREQSADAPAGGPSAGWTRVRLLPRRSGAPCRQTSGSRVCEERRQLSMRVRSTGKVCCCKTSPGERCAEDPRT